MTYAVSFCPGVLGTREAPGSFGEPRAGVELQLPRRKEPGFLIGEGVCAEGRGESGGGTGNIRRGSEVKRGVLFFFRCIVWWG